MRKKEIAEILDPDKPVVGKFSEQIKTTVKETKQPAVTKAECVLGAHETTSDKIVTVNVCTGCLNIASAAVAQSRGTVDTSDESSAMGV